MSDTETTTNPDEQALRMKRAQLLAMASEACGLDSDHLLSDFIERRSEESEAPSVYVFVGEHGSAKVTEAQLRDFKYCAIPLGRVTGMGAPNHRKPLEWMGAVRALLKAARVEMFGIETSEVGIVQEALLAVLSRSDLQPVSETDNPRAYADALLRGQPVRRADGSVWFSVSPIVSHMNIAMGVKLSTFDTVAALTVLGCGEREAVHYNWSPDPEAVQKRRLRRLYRLSAAMEEQIDW